MSIDWNEDYRDEDCKGGVGKSWFSLYYQGRGGEGNSWFMVEVTSEHVPGGNDSTGIFLDTTAPKHPTFIINNGGATTDEQIVTAHLAHCDYPIRRGYQIKIWGDVDTEYDPAIARHEEQSQWIAFTPTYLFKLSRYNGSKRLYAKIRDDVWNETATLSFTVTFTGGEQPVEVGKAADSPGFTALPIIGKDFEQSWAAEIDTRIPVSDLAEISGNVSLIKNVTISASGKVSASRKVQFSTEGVRLEASRWNKLINEDEELLLNI